MPSNQDQNFGAVEAAAIEESQRGGQRTKEKRQLLLVEAENLLLDVASLQIKISLFSFGWPHLLRLRCKGDFKAVWKAKHNCDAETKKQ